MKLSTFTGEALASVVVFLVALPLCMGIAIASGVPPAMGLISGIVGGLIVGSLAGSPLQVSGPAAGLAVIVYEIVQEHGLGVLAVIIILAGVLQISAGFLKIGQWFRAIAPTVIYAMLAGIGVLIFASQFHVMVDDTPSASGLTNLLTIPQAVSKGITPLDDSPHHIAAALGLLTLVILVAYNAIKPRLPKSVAMLPAPLLAVASATVAANIMKLPVSYVQAPNSFMELFRFPSTTDFFMLTHVDILGAAIAMAAVASAESLLSAVAVDKLHQGERTDYDRELMAQGVGNVILGFIGGLPVTGVIVRSSANVEAGAKTRLSAVLHGAWLLLALALFPGLLQTIPVASLAAVLVYIGYKLVKIEAIKELWARGRTEVAIYVITVVTIVSTNLLEGLLLGLALSVLRLAFMSSRLLVEISEENGEFIVGLKGAATFVGLPKLAQALESLPQEATVHLCLEHLSYIDHACFDLIADWERQRQPFGGTLIMKWHELERRNEEMQIPAAVSPQAAAVRTSAAPQSAH